MPRSNWKGFISFGLVSIPIVLYTAENKKADISFHQIDRRNNARIKYKRINVDTGKEVPWEDITRGYEYDKNTIVPVPDDILQKVAGDSSRLIDIKNFINKNELDFLSIDRNYYLLPDEKGKGNKGYVILREALKGLNKIGIARVIISTKEYIAAVMPYRNALILSLLKYAAEMRKVSELDLPDKPLSHYKINQKEIEMAKQLIKTMASKWKPEEYVDEYQEKIHIWVDETVKNLPHKSVRSRKKPSPQVVNFIELLKKSLAKQGKNTKKKKTSYPKPRAKTAHHAVKH